MNLAPTDEQSMLGQVARDYLDARFPVNRLSRDDAERWDAEDWAEIAELGWTGIALVEDVGGAGLGLAEQAILAEEMGRALFPGPFFATVVLALPLLTARPDDLSRVLAGDATATLAAFDERRPVATQEDGVWRITGSCRLVPDLLSSERIVVEADVGGGASALLLLDTQGDGLAREDQETLDPTRPLGVLTLQHAVAELLIEPGEPTAVTLDGIRQRAMVVLAAEAVGVAGRALDLAVEHARERRQFGRPIGSFQAVSQELASAFVEIDSARSLTRWAAWRVDQRSSDASQAARSAKGYAAEVAVATVERALQVHGGVGFTWEHPLHRFYRRALWIAAFLGWPPIFYRELGEGLLEQEEER